MYAIVFSNQVRTMPEMIDPASSRLERVKSRVWFYKFELPDGSITDCDVPDYVIGIHSDRLEKLREVIATHVPDAGTATAIDFASHEGFYTHELARHFRHAVGLEIKDDSRDHARLITDTLGFTNIEYRKADLQSMRASECELADFVLVYGLLYHVENPIHTLRLASQLSRKHILIETQVFPYDISGPIEDGNFLAQRPVCGVFSLSADYSHHREGGSTDIALVPSLNALVFLLKTFGFSTVEVLKFDRHNYEQFYRGSRVIVYGTK
jgi:tRNA (mo5U34)-methyltransferase